VVSIDEMATQIQVTATAAAIRALDFSGAADPAFRDTVERNRDAITIGIQAGIAGALMALVETGILPGAFDGDVGQTGHGS
jgi:hypothetical protein